MTAVYRTTIEFKAASMADANDLVENLARLHPSYDIKRPEFARSATEENRE